MDLSSFKATEEELHYMSIYKSTIKSIARYHYNPTETNLSRQLYDMDICAKQLLEINKNIDIKKRYYGLIESNITNKEYLCNALYNIINDIIIENGLVEKMYANMILDRIEKLIKDFSFYLVTTAIITLFISYLFNDFSKISVSMWLFLSLWFYVPFRIREIYSLYKDIRLYVETH